MKVTKIVAALFGIVKASGLLDEPPEQDAPVTLQPEDCQLAEDVAVTEIDEPTASEQPLGQLGLTEPLPQASFVVKA